MAVVLIGFAIRGLLKGFFRELFSLVGLFIGLWIALLKYVAVGDWLRNTLPLADPLPYHVAFLFIFLGISIAAGMLGYLLHRAAKFFLVGWLDAIIGLGFGFGKGVMISTVLLFLIGSLPLSEAVISQLRTSTIVARLATLNPFVQQSVQAYKEFGTDFLWERRRLPKLHWPPTRDDGVAAEEAATR
jgi:membrane protein required for colicin V production